LASRPEVNSGFTCLKRQQDQIQSGNYSGKG
jgi:hypothetical protein